MDEIFDLEAWREVFVTSLSELGAGVAAFLPNLAATLALLLAGWIVSRLAESIARRVLERIGLDRALNRLRSADALRRAGVPAPSRVFSLLLFWTLMLTFALTAAETLGFSAVTGTIERLVAYLPNVIAAGLIALLGLVLGRLVRNGAASAAAAAGLHQAHRLGGVLGSLVVLFVSVLALEQLGVRTDLLVTLMTVAVAVAGLTVGVALALGSRPVVTHVLAGHFLRASLPPGTALEVSGRKGTVDRVGPVETLLRDGGASWSVPNGALLDATIGR